MYEGLSHRTHYAPQKAKKPIHHYYRYIPGRQRGLPIPRCAAINQYVPYVFFVDIYHPWVQQKAFLSMLVVNSSWFSWVSSIQHNHRWLGGRKAFI